MRTTGITTTGITARAGVVPQESAVQLFTEVALADRYAGFLALPACERMPSTALVFDVAFSVDVAFSADNAETATATENTTGS